MTVLIGVLVVASVALMVMAVAVPLPVLGVVAAAAAGAGWLLRQRASRGRASGWVGVVAWMVAAVAVLTTLAVGLLWARAAPPQPDAFYEPPAGAPTDPGRLLRLEPSTSGVPPGARAWRVLYATTRRDGVPAVASAVVLAPDPLPEGPRPIVAWTHGTTGIAPGCAPSVLPPPFPFDQAVPAVAELLAEGWVLVGTDYVGLGTAGPHPYLIGEGEGRSALDAVRAARQVPGLQLGDRTVVWGHSQGGHAALWTGILAPDYAPDAGVVGVAALAPATDLVPMLEAIKDTTVGTLMASYVMSAYSAAYEDVTMGAYIGPRRRAEALAGRCLSGPGVLLSIATALTLERPLFSASPSSGPLQRRLLENTPARPIVAPVLIAQGDADVLVLPSLQRDFVRRRCAAGQALTYRTYDGRDHLSVLAPGSPLIPELVDWTRARFAGESQPDGCRQVRP